MDPRLLSYYNRELQFVRELGAEFAAEYPKIAGRLGIDVFECNDPYVERLLEGFALLAARVQLRLDAEFPRFTQHLLEMVYPDYLAPQPSMAVVQFQADMNEGSLAEGFRIPRHTSLFSLLGKGESTRCRFRTAADFDLWPLQLTSAAYYLRDVAALKLPDVPGVKAALVLRLRTTAGLRFNEIGLDRLPIHIRGASDIPARIYEQLGANVKGVVARAVDASAPWSGIRDPRSVSPTGFGDQESLLPGGPRSFQGYRLLQEYLSFPQRFMFFELRDLQPVVQKCAGDELEVAILLDRGDTNLANRVDANDFGLHCVPAINLFPKAPTGSN